MNNIFHVPPNIEIRERYDIKGSVRNRFVANDRTVNGESRVLKDTNFVLSGKRVNLSEQMHSLASNQLEVCVQIAVPVVAVRARDA